MTDIKIHLNLSTNIIQFTTQFFKETYCTVGLIQSNSNDSNNFNSDELISIEINSNKMEQSNQQRIRMKDFYTSIHFSLTKNELIGIKELSKTFEILKLERNSDGKDMSISVINIIPTIHSSSSFCLNIYDSIISFGLDGRIVIYDEHYFYTKFSLITHSIFTGGIKKAIHYENAK